MKTFLIKAADKSNQESLIALIMLAFATDPMARWISGPA
jgi:hypothetical protein